MTKTPGPVGHRRHTAEIGQPPHRRADEAPITMPGPKMPPEPPLPMDSEVATILAMGSTQHDPQRDRQQPFLVVAICTQP